MTAPRPARTETLLRARAGREAPGRVTPRPRPPRTPWHWRSPPFRPKNNDSATKPCRRSAVLTSCASRVCVRITGRLHLRRWGQFRSLLRGPLSRSRADGTDILRSAATGRDGQTPQNSGRCRNLRGSRGSDLDMSTVRGANLIMRRAL
jgi:hypothetical protein